MINNSFSTGASAIGLIFLGVLLIPFEKEKDLENKINLSKKILESEGYLTVPLIMDKLGCNAKSANKIINELFERGFIKQ